MLNSLFNGSISPVTINLRPTGHSGTHLMLNHISGNLFLKFFYKLWSLRSWSYKTHISFQHVKKLWKLINTGFPHKLSEIGHPGVVLHQAQVNGYRGNTSIRKRIEYDLYYIENWTLGLDVKILFLTVFKGFINKNAY